MYPATTTGTRAGPAPATPTGRPAVRCTAGYWRIAAAGPAILASCAVVLLAALAAATALPAPAPALGLLLPALWAGAALALASRPGERAAVRLACRFRPARPAERALLEPALTPVLAAAGLPAGRVDLYVRPGRGIRAWAAGARSIAVTEKLIEETAAGRHPQVVTAALLAHELGHIAAPAARWQLTSRALAAPWRTLARLLLGPLWAILGRHQPRAALAVLAAAAVVTGTAQLAAAHATGGAITLPLAALAAAGGPLAAAAAARAAETAADTYAAHLGYGPALTHALASPDTPPPPGRARRPLASHPATAARLADLARHATAGTR